MGQGSSSNEQQEQPNTPKTIQQFSTQNKHDPSERIEGDVMPITISKYNQDPALANAFKCSERHQKAIDTAKLISTNFLHDHHMFLGAEVCITVEKAVDNDLSSEMLAYRTRKAGPLMTTGTIPHLTTPEIVQSKDPEVNWNIQVRITPSDTSKRAAASLFLSIPDRYNDVPILKSVSVRPNPGSEENPCISMNLLRCRSCL